MHFIKRYWQLSQQFWMNILLVLAIALPFLIRLLSSSRFARVTTALGTAAALADGLPVVSAQASNPLPTDAEYALFVVANMTLLSSLAGAANFILSNNTVFLPGSNGHCFSKIQLTGTGDPFSPRIIGEYGKTTSTKNNCVDLILNKNGTLLFAADNKNGGLSIIDPNTLQLIGNLPGFNAHAVVLSDDEKIAYVLAEGSSSEARLYLLDVSNPANLQSLRYLSLPWPNAGNVAQNAAMMTSVELHLVKQGTQLLVSYSGWDVSGTRSFYDNTACIVDATNATALTIWKKINFYRMMELSQAVISAFTAIGKKFMVTTRRVSANQAISDTGNVLRRGIYTLSAAGNTSALSVVNMAPHSASINTLWPLPGEKRALIGDDSGVAIFDIAPFIPTDPSKELFKRSIPGGVTHVAKSDSNPFVIIVRTRKGLSVCFLQENVPLPPLSTFYAIPVFENHVDAILKTDENNAGKLVFYNTSQTGTAAQQIYPAPTGVNTSVNTSWFVLNYDASTFTANPPVNMIGERVVVRVNFGGGSYTDVSFQIARGSSPLPVETTKSLTFFKTAAPTNTPPKTPIPSTTQPSTSSVSTATPNPTMLTVLPLTPAPTDPVLVPGATFAPQSNLEIISSEAKLRVVSTAGIVTVKVKVKPGSGEFMLTRLGNRAIDATMNPSLGILTLVGAPTDLNLALAELRFSAEDSTSDMLTVFATLDGNAWVKTDGHLSQFGVNHAPIIKIPETKVNITLPLDSKSSIPLSTYFKDIDGDPLSYDAESNNEPIKVTKGLLPVHCDNPDGFKITMKASDGYKNSPPLDVDVICEFVPLVLKNPLPPVTFGVNEEIVWTLPPDTFEGNDVSYSMKQMNGSPLPPNLSFDPNLRQLRGKFNYETKLKLLMTATTRAEKVDTTLDIEVFDHAPVVAPIPDQIVRAGKTVKFVVKATDADKHDVLTGELDRSSPSSVKYDPDTQTIEIAPLASAMGKNFSVILKISDGTKLGYGNFTLIVPENIPPTVGAPFENAVATIGTFFSYRVPPNAFNSINPLTCALTLLNKEITPRWMRVNPDCSFEGTPDEAGQLELMATAADALDGSRVVQEFEVWVELSSWNKAERWLGIAGGALTVAGFAYGSYQNRITLLNIVRGKRYVIPDPFSHKDNEPNPTYKVEYDKEKDIISVRCRRRANHRALDCLHRIIAAVLLPISHYGYGLHALVELTNNDTFPLWLTYSNADDIFTIHPELITSGDEPVVVQILRNHSGAFEILKEFVVDPQDYRSIELVVTRSQDCQPTELVATTPPPSQSKKEELTEPLLQVPTIDDLPTHNNPRDSDDSADRRGKNPLPLSDDSADSYDRRENPLPLSRNPKKEATRKELSKRSNDMIGYGGKNFFYSPPRDVSQMLKPIEPIKPRSKLTRSF